MDSNLSRNKIGVKSDDFSLVLVGRVLGSKLINWGKFTSILSELWSPAFGVQVKPLPKDHPNRFLFTFKHVKDRNRALYDGPWHYNYNLIVLAEIDTVAGPENTALDWANFNVRVAGLPFGKTTKETAEIIGNSIGKFRSVDFKQDGYHPHVYFRIRVGIDVRIPLRRVLKVQVGTRLLIQLSLSYEKLPNFCYYCGLLSHIVKYCPCQYEVEGELEEEQFGYGEWLRGGFRRRGAISGSSVDRPEAFKPSTVRLQTHEISDRKVWRARELFRVHNDKSGLVSLQSDVKEVKGNSMSMCELRKAIESDAFKPVAGCSPDNKTSPLAIQDSTSVPSQGDRHESKTAVLERPDGKDKQLTVMRQTETAKNSNPEFSATKQTHALKIVESNKRPVLGETSVELETQSQMVSGEGLSSSNSINVVRTEQVTEVKSEGKQVAKLTGGVDNSHVLLGNGNGTTCSLLSSTLHPAEKLRAGFVGKETGSSQSHLIDVPPLSSLVGSSRSRKLKTPIIKKKSDAEGGATKDTMASIPGKRKPDSLNDDPMEICEHPSKRHDSRVGLVGSGLEFILAEAAQQPGQSP